MRILGVQLLKSSDLGRHSLLYLKEIGHGWFGRVLLGEVSAGLSTTQVVVKELKASASVQDQMQFLEEVQPYRALQHPALVQCLAQCSEVTPYLLVMEFCPLGDLKSYLHSCRLAHSDSPDPLILQRMACDVASGLVHLHKYNFIHSDLALRNCLLTSEMSVKIGDYGLSHSRYKDDYYITQDQIWVPLRWIAPELIDEVHGNLLVVDQTKSSNIWSLGVTMWELFELGNQPYRHYSDRQVLMYAVKEQQLKLPKPQVHFPLLERWYEVMQFCWLQPELRPSSEEVHLLVTYLCAKGSSEAEEDFEQRWNALRPNLLGSTTHSATSTALVLTPTPASAEDAGAEQTQAVELASSASSSFPLLEHFSDSFHSDTGDDLLTVTETSHGLNFEYKWEQARAEQPYCSSSTSGPLGQGNPHYQDIYYTSKGSTSGGCKTDSLASSVSPSYFEPEQPGVVPVLSAHSPSVSSEYYIRIEEPVDCHISSLDDSVVGYSPGHETNSRKLSLEGQTGSSTAQPSSYWATADKSRSIAYDSDSSPTVQLNMEPLMRHASRSSPGESGHSSYSCFSPNRDENILCKQSSTHMPNDQAVFETSPECRSNRIHAIGYLENPRGVSQAVSSPSLGFCDPYLDASTGRSTVNESCHNIMGALRKTIPIVNHISIDVETDNGLLVGQQSDEEFRDDLFSVEEAPNWTSNHSANNNSLSFSRRQKDSWHDNYMDLRYTENCDSKELWSLTKATTRTFSSSKACSAIEASERCEGTDIHKSSELGTCLHFYHNDNMESATQLGRNLGVENSRENDSIRLRYAETSENASAYDSGISMGNSGMSLVELGDYSEDEDNDITDITSGIFADFNLDYAEIEEEELSPIRRPDRPHGITDSLNLSSSAASTSDQAFSPDPFNTVVLPKSLDSGYDTENNESPEFIFKELTDLRGAERNPRTEQDPELVVQVGLGEEVCTSTSIPELKRLSDKSPYRDSAYFSDYDAEADRSPEEEGSTIYEGLGDNTLITKKFNPARNDDGVIKMQYDGQNPLTNLGQNKNDILVNFLEAEPSTPHHLPDPGFSMLSPFPPEMGGCLTKESAPADDDLGLETEHSAEEPPTEINSSIGSEHSSTVQEASGNHGDENGGPENCSCAHSRHSGSSRTDYRDDTLKENEAGDGSTEEEDLPEFSCAQEEVEDKREPVRLHEEEFEDIDAEECDSQDSLCGESNGPVSFSSSSSLLELCGEDVRAPLEEAEDEDDSDDSESDEELRTYNIQDEDSEESEEEVSAVPVVISDCSRSRHLRSLLKMPTLLTQSFCNELERKKKAVSFFDDVTVFLFDQESPTGELVDYGFSMEEESNEHEASEQMTSGNELQEDPETQVEVDARSCETFCESGETCETNSEQGEWKNDLLIEPPQRSFPDAITEPQTSPTSALDSPESPKPAAVALSRFMVSRFSITHVSDPQPSAATDNGEDSSTD